jgi:hypothetical protein
VSRLLLLALLIGLVAPPCLVAQSLGSSQFRINGLPPVLEEHATGGEVPFALGAVSLMGMMTYDIVTAPSAARRYNERQDGVSTRSPRTALILSSASTAIPIGLGITLANRGFADDSALFGTGIVMAMGGAVVGPGAGHWYAGRRSVAIRHAGIRAALLLGSIYFEGCCS